jgi:hypothetical protein
VQTNKKCRDEGKERESEVVSPEKDKKSLVAREGFG